MQIFEQASACAASCYMRQKRNKVRGRTGNTKTKTCASMQNNLDDHAACMIPKSVRRLRTHTPSFESTLSFEPFFVWIIFPKKPEYFMHIFSFETYYACMTTNSVRQSRVNQRWRLNRLLFKSCFPKNNKKTKNISQIFFWKQTICMHDHKQRSAISCESTLAFEPSFV